MEEPNRRKGLGGAETSIPQAAKAGVQGGRITLHAELLACRELVGALGLTETHQPICEIPEMAGAIRDKYRLIAS